MGQLNLLPESYVRERFRYRIDLMCVILFAVVMGSVMGAEAVSRSRINETKDLHTRVTAQYSEATKFIKAFFQLQGERNYLLKEAEIAASMEEHIPRSYLLAVITNSLRGSVSLEDVTISAVYPRYKPIPPKKTAKGTKPGKPKVPDLPQIPPIITVELVGLAEKEEDIGAFIAALRASKLISRLEHKYSRDDLYEKKYPVSRFSLFIRVRRDLDVLDLMVDEPLPETLPAAAPGVKPQTRPASGGNRPGGDS